MSECNNQEEILKSMTDFLIINENNNIPTIDLYNKWSKWSNIIITNDDVMEECLSVLGKAKSTDIDFMKEGSQGGM